MCRLCCHLSVIWRLSSVNIFKTKIYCSETAGRIKAKFPVQLPRTKLTNIVCRTVLIYGKNPSNIFFSRTTGPLATILVMDHCYGPIIVCSNDDLELTLTYFRPRSNLVTLAFLWKKVGIFFLNYCSL